MSPATSKIMVTHRFTARLVACFALAALVIGGCSAAPEDNDASEGADAVSAGGRTVTLYYLGSQKFLRACAGETLGCGKKVASVPDTTPYFSAPNGGGTTCDEYWTFRVNGRCVEARRLESSDSHGFIEGNPGLFDALGLPHSDGVNCSGSGTKPGVLMERGRKCGDAQKDEDKCGGNAEVPVVGTELVTTADLNLRDAPSTSGKILGVAPPNETVVATGESPRDTWYSVKWNGIQGWMFGEYLASKDGRSLGQTGDGCDEGKGDEGKGDEGKGEGAFTISDKGRSQMSAVVRYADSHHSGASRSRCFEYVWRYLYQSTYGLIDQYGDCPEMGSAEARMFAEYMNAGSNAKRWGLQRLPIDNPYDAPVGAVVVVKAGSPGTSHPTAGDISIAAGGGRFINDGPTMSYGGSASEFRRRGGRVLGVYAPL